MDKTYYVKAAIKLCLIALLVGCLFKMPYGYYQFVRFATCFLFAAHAVYDYKLGFYLNSVISVLFAVLLNPFAKFVFKRNVWQNIDKAIVVLLTIALIIETSTFLRRRLHSSTS